jgi:nucleoid DNA-binding protein
MNKKINLQDLIALVIEKSDTAPNDAEILVNESFNIIEENLIKDKFMRVRNLGIFKLVWIEDRESVDSATGEKTLIPAHYAVTFTPDIELAETVNTSYAALETTEIGDSKYPETDGTDDDEETEVADEINEPPVQPNYFWGKTNLPETTENKPAELKTDPEKKPEIITPKPKEPEEKPKIIATEPKITTLTSKKDPAIIATEPKDPEKTPDINKIENETPKDEPKHIDKEYNLPYDEDIEDELYYDDEPRTGTSKILFWTLVAIIAGLVVFFAGRYFYPKIQTQLQASAIPDSITILSSTDNLQEITTAPTTEQEIPATEQETPAEPTPAVEKQQPISTPPPAQPAEPKTQTAEIQPAKPPGYKQHTVSRGERLNIIALQEYGHKAFWVYIYDENRDVIDNPDIIEPGTIINIPPAKKYNINVNNPESVNKALKLQQLYKTR